MPLKPGAPVGHTSRAFPVEPGAKNKAGTTAKVKLVPRSTFRASIGHGTSLGGSQTGTGGASGDPTISYRRAGTWAAPLGRTGKFGTQDQVGKRPLNYNYDMSSFLLEY